MDYLFAALSCILGSALYFFLLDAYGADKSLAISLSLLILVYAIAFVVKRFRKANESTADGQE